MIRAQPHERSGQRTNYRNGSRRRLLTSQVGDLDLRIPKLRQGSLFPALERRRRVDEALYAVWRWKPMFTGCRPGTSMTE